MVESDKIKLAQLAEQNVFIIQSIQEQKEVNQRMLDSFEKLSAQIIQIDANRYADEAFLRQSIKRKIDEAVGRLQKLHESDVHNIKTDVTKINDNPIVKIGFNKTLFYAIAVIFLYSFWNEITLTINSLFKKQGMEQNDVKIVTRGGEVFTIKDTIQ